MTPSGITIGRIITYRSRTGKYDVPAIVTATVDSLIPEGVEAGHVPALSGEDHVHLTVFSPGKPGLRLGAEDFEVPPSEERPVDENVGGSYREWDEPLDSGGATPDQPLPGTWRWPERV